MKRDLSVADYSAKRSAQGYLCNNDSTEKPTGACGSACGADDDKPAEPKPTACSSACGAGDGK